MWLNVVNQWEDGSWKIEDERQGPEPWSSAFGLRAILISFLIFQFSSFPIFNTKVNAQVLGLNQASPDASSVFDAVATNRGVLIPRMTTAQRTGIAAPADGLLVFDTDLDAFYYYDATAAANWRPILAGLKGSTLIAGNISMADATVLDLSAIDASSTTEGLILPQAASITAATAEGQISWDTDNDLLQVGTGTAMKTIGIPNNIQVFTANGTWTRPANVTQVWVRVWGGGGGAADATEDVPGGGGGGGGYSEGLITVAADAAVVVGTAGGAGAPGTAGGTSSFAGTVTIQATGGSGGTTNTGGAGGVGSNGTINLTGGTGGNAPAMDGGGGGAGGGSPMGGAGGSGGTGSNASGPDQDGKAGAAPGGGGGGGSDDAGSSSGAGAKGMVIVYY